MGILRSGDEATLSAFGPRPIDLATKKLVDEFGVVVNVDDSHYFYRDEWDATPPRVANSGSDQRLPRVCIICGMHARLEKRRPAVGSLQQA